MSQVNEEKAVVEEEKTTETEKTETMNMLDLPPEIQRQILACLPNETLSESVRLVCRAWDKEALAIITNVYRRFVHRFNAANLDSIYANYNHHADILDPAGIYKPFRELEKTLRLHFGALMECGLPCLIPGLILDETIWLFNWLLSKANKPAFPPRSGRIFGYSDDMYNAQSIRHMPRRLIERIEKALFKGQFQAYFTRLTSLPLEVTMGRRDSRLRPSLARSYPYTAPEEITRLRIQAQSYRRKAEEAEEREEALLRAIAQKAGKDEEWERLLTQHQEARHLSRAQEAEEERARLRDQNQKALAQLQEEMGEERERYRALFDQGVYKPPYTRGSPHQPRLTEKGAQEDHEKALLLMEVEHFNALVHQAELTPLHFVDEAKCDALRDLASQAEHLVRRLRSLADQKGNRLYKEAERAETKLQNEQVFLAQWEQQRHKQGERKYTHVKEACQQTAAKEETLPARLRSHAEFQWELFQTRADQMETEQERLLALLPLHPEQDLPEVETMVTAVLAQTERSLLTDSTAPSSTTAFPIEQVESQTEVELSPSLHTDDGTPRSTSSSSPLSPSSSNKPSPR